MAQVALLAEFEVEAQDLDRFLAAAKRELAAVRQSEPGCLRFDVILLDGDGGRGVFVEVFRDQAAAESHRETAHFAAFFEEIAGKASGAMWLFICIRTCLPACWRHWPTKSMPIIRFRKSTGSNLLMRR